MIGYKEEKIIMTVPIIRTLILSLKSSTMKRMLDNIFNKHVSNNIK